MLPNVRRFPIPLLAALAFPLLAGGCSHYAELGFRPPENQVVRHAVQHDMRFDFGLSTLRAVETVVYDRRTTAFDGRPARNRVNLRSAEIEADPWDHPAVQGRTGTLMSLEGQEFRVDLDKNFQASVVHVGGNEAKAENFARFWQFGDEEMIYPVFFQPMAIWDGHTWSGEFNTGRTRGRASYEVLGVTSGADGQRLYRIVGKVAGQSRITSDHFVDFTATVEGLYDPKNCYFRETTIERMDESAELRVRRVIKRGARHFDEYTLPPVDRTGLSPWQSAPEAGLKIEASGRVR